MPRRRQRPATATIEAELRSLRDALLAAEATHTEQIESVHLAHRRSAANLVHYVELRNHDVRRLQVRLGALGLSSLGRSESHVLATIEAVLTLVCRLNGTTPPRPAAGVALGEGSELLAANAGALLGPAPHGRSTRIMVTLPSEAAHDPELVARLFADGMDVARVNCAHDDAEAWQHMFHNIRRCSDSSGRTCRVATDLGGPKLRTGPLQAGPQAARIAPDRDRLGKVTRSGLVWLGPGTVAPGVVGSRKVTALPVTDTGWLQRRRVGDRIDLTDTRGATRSWEIIGEGIGGWLASAERTTYVATGLRLTCLTTEGPDVVAIGELPATDQSHRVVANDHVVLTRSLTPAEPTGPGEVHRIGCTLPEVFGRVAVGQRVWLDDGKIGGVICRVAPDEIELTVSVVRPGGANLKAGKGINLPDTDLSLAALTAKDLDDLAFVARHTDIVNASFVRRPDDVVQLQSELRRLDATNAGIVLKIENVTAFGNLPDLLLAAMSSERVGVMIARGDLAVEVGFERMAEVQEEILWACEAAHVPVVWATQVLDTLARTGLASRAEVTDAAMAERAECVMLNKGPHIHEAIVALDSILSRMQHHQHKKRSLLRRLQAWDHPADAG
ncbi:MAG: pyruvate kinase [Actinomycetota bacterium]|nr:pyruvate kinase [Actinomycetota bacterium]